MKRASVVVVAIAIAVAVGIAVARPAHAPDAPVVQAPVETVAPIVPAPIETVAPPPPPSEPPPMPTPRARPRVVEGADDPCAPDEEVEAFARPSITQVLEARQSELAARARASAGASAALREGLDRLARGGDVEGAITMIANAPDRLVTGFDHAAAAALHVGIGALSEGRLRDAERWARRASSLSREDPAGPVLEALVALRDDDEARAKDALREAFSRDAEDPAIAWALATRTARSEDVELAMRALEVYLAEYPEDVRARRIRARARQLAIVLRGTTRRVRRGVVLRAPSDLDAAVIDRALATVDDALGEAARWTRTTRATELLVVVHHDATAMRAATCAPTWSGALFDGSLHVDAETLRGPEARARIALRHESLHAQLHARPGGGRRAPYWLDEGMAQRFSGEESPDHHRSWAMMVRSRMWIPMDSIAGSFLEIDDPSDARLAYHQSLAMVRYLESTRGERAIGDAIAEIDRGTSPEELLARLAPELDGARLLAFLAER
ncbi:hypothetical protein [Sandaracinus amylolyticus]|uniref:hypothetical protein n=1 Tax=Sandaracinus amylolyticus TaxID=927083 RepID=UPI001F40D543|nr:hypothetical protein [Sandaracinus amylolyticus]UJR82694.1 Hypothetical protein I5071_47590 [Sandaracinus amylolyticus]